MQRVKKQPKRWKKDARTKMGGKWLFFSFFHEIRPNAKRRIKRPARHYASLKYSKYVDAETLES